MLLIVEEAASVPVLRQSAWYQTCLDHVPCLLFSAPHGFLSLHVPTWIHDVLKLKPTVIVTKLKKYQTRWQFKSNNSFFLLIQIQQMIFPKILSANYRYFHQAFSHLYQRFVNCHLCSKFFVIHITINHTSIYIVILYNHISDFLLQLL